METKKHIWPAYFLGEILAENYYIMICKINTGLIVTPLKRVYAAGKLL
jgi:hypothetical protein